jgi:hypothetical protein
MIRRKIVIMALAAGLIMLTLSAGWAADRVIAGVGFPEEKTIDGKALKLNGVALRTKFFIKVYAGGFYLENPTNDAEEAINSEQIKHFHLHYLTSKATAEKLQHGFKEAITKANPPELVQKYQNEIERYASWLDQDMAPGATSIATYIPGKGLTLVFKGREQGTIASPEFAKMYFRYNLGEKADKKLRQGYLGE